MLYRTLHPHRSSIIVAFNSSGAFTIRTLLLSFYHWTFCGGEGTIDRGNGKETCANCNGKGQFKCGYCKNGERICTCCNGTGKQRHVGR